MTPAEADLAWLEWLRYATLDEIEGWYCAVDGSTPEWRIIAAEREMEKRHVRAD